MEEVIISDSAVFDMQADNYEDFDQEIDKKKLEPEFTQENTQKGTLRKYQLYAQTHLFLNFTEKQAKAKKFHVNLAWLSSEPEHSKVIVWKWLYIALAAVALTGLSIYLSMAQLVQPEYCLIAGITTSTVALISGLIFIYCMRNEFIFKSFYGDARLFLVENKKPDQGTFDSFYIDLQRSIDNAKSALSVTERLVGELKMCRRLRDEGVIDDKAYTTARTKIFKHEQYKS